MLSFQEKIGARTASALSIRVMPLAREPNLTTSGDVYNLYLTARGLIRTRQPPQLETAIALLECALQLDPNYAPAWSSLGTVKWILAEPGDDEGQAEAKEAVGRALRLAPSLADAHGAMGLILGFGSVDGGRHVEQAVRLDPNSAELQFWLGQVRANRGDFEGQLVAFRRSVALDPLWPQSSSNLVDTAVQLGYHDVARAETGRFVRLADLGGGDAAKGYLALAQGDYSDAIRWFRVATRNLPSSAREPIGAEHDGVMELLELPEQNPSLSAVRQARLGPLPTVAEVRTRNSQGDRQFTARSVKRFLNARRGGELVDIYESPTGLLGTSHAGPATNVDLVEYGADVALVLRAAGEVAEANRLLDRVGSEITRAMRRGRVPHWFHAAAARTWSVIGRKEQALTALDEAARRGWTGRWDNSFADIAEEPSFAPLRADPRFERVRRLLVERLEKERREVRALPRDDALAY